MKWKLASEEKPIYENEVDHSNEVKCLCKLHNSDYKTILTYVLDKDEWLCDNEEPHYFMKYNDVDKWVKLSDLDDLLEGKPEPMWCWEFGQTLAETAVPALDHWIKHGCSYECGMTPESWKELLGKIKRAFEVSLYDLNDSVLDVPDVKERQRITEEHAKIRKEGFDLLAEHWLSMWD